jgi:hypothetical protein
VFVINKSAAGATDYPNLFKKTYWGSHTSWDLQIIANRNQFVKDYGVIGLLKTPSYFCFGIGGRSPIQGMFMDHAEFYAREDKGVVFVVSPNVYLDEHEIEYPAIAEYFHFDSPYQLYTKTSLSFIKCFGSMKDFKGWWDEGVAKVITYPHR